MTLRETDRTLKSFAFLADPIPPRGRGQLAGKTVGIKDIFDVAGMPTANGLSLPPRIATEDSWVAAKMRGLGLSILGKTATTACAYLDPAPTLNPLDPTRTPGGSSSGSAAAVAAKLCDYAVATQTGGSTIRPASFCGIAAIVPTWGKLPLTGCLPLAPVLDHVGLMAKDAKSLGVLWKALTTEAGRDHDGDVVCLSGMFDDLAEPDMRRLFHDWMDREEILESRRIDFTEIRERHYRLMARQAAGVHLTGLYDDHSEVYPPRITELIEDGRDILDSQYAADLAARDRDEMEFVMMIEDAIWVTPAALGAAPDRATTGDSAFNAMWAYLHFPTVTVPFAKTSDGLPLGVQLIAAPGRDADLLRFAAGLEKT